MKLAYTEVLVSELCWIMSRHGVPQLFADLEQQVVACTRCPRLRKHCLQVARVKRRAYRDWNYWGKPVPAFGDPMAKAPDYWPSARRPRRQSHRTHVHRR